MYCPYLLPLFYGNETGELGDDAILLADVDDVRLPVSLHNLHTDTCKARIIRHISSHTHSDNSLSTV